MTTENQGERSKDWEKKVKLLQNGKEFVVLSKICRNTSIFRKSCIKRKLKGLEEDIWILWTHCSLKQEEFLKGTPAGEDIEIPDKIKPVCKPNA